MSSFGDLKYPEGFPHFDYVDPKAPKGGVFSQIGPGTIYNQNSLTFNSLNSYILRGDAAQGMELTFASLMARADDEPDAMYGLAARAVRISADGLTYRFLLRPEARFHDGSALTAHDVAFSLATLKEKGHPIITQFLRDFAGCEAVDDATVTCALRAETRARRAAVRRRRCRSSRAPITASGRSTKPTLDIPLGSGPYEVGRFEAGRYHRIQARRGLVGRRSAGGARPEQLRHRALRILSRPRGRLRRLHRQELSVPRGVHLAHLGDALQLPRRSRTAASSAT